MRPLLHNLAHRHAQYRRDGLGDFHLCSPRRPAPAVRIWFRPASLDPVWHPVPCARDADGRLLFERMLKAENGAAAMALLHAASQGEGFS